MSGNRFRLFLLVVVAILFVAGQFHLCVDTNSDAYGAHICPFCATAGSAILALGLSMATVPVLSKLEVTAVAFEISADLPRTTSPRAPPALT
jgi:hypothetical protein